MDTRCSSNQVFLNPFTSRAFLTWKKMHLSENFEKDARVRGYTIINIFTRILWIILLK